VSLIPPANSPIAAGYRLDRYELMCPIAEGGMASVWIARQTGKHGFQKLVAIKTILPKYAAEPTFQSMFVDEARIASRIEHANVTQILDVGEQHGVTYLVMEYVDGDALSKINRAAKKKDAKVPLGIVLRVMADVSGGLHAAHELRDEAGALMGVVHRDVSPQNVLVTTRGVAKLIDFGIAKAKGRLSGDTNADQLKGKVHYMPPEQALGKPVDRRADVWAVGAVIYHLISGRPPFDAENEIQTLFQVTSGKSPTPLPPSTPLPVREVIKKALMFAPDARYPTAAALQQALEEAMVQANLTTSTSTVAAFLAEMVGDRAERRQEAISLGLKAASDREKVAEIMRSNTETTKATSDTGARVSAPTRLESTSSVTGQTLSTGPGSIPSLQKGRGLTVGLAAGAATLVIGGAVFALSNRSKPSPVTAAAPPPVVAAAASIPPPEPVPTAVPTGVPADGPSEAAAPAASSTSTSATSHPGKRWTYPARSPGTTTKPTTAPKERENYGF